MIFILKLTLNMELIDTPNPNAKKIIPNENLLTKLNLDNFRIFVSENLESLEGVESIFFGPNFLTITKEPNIKWDLITQDIVDIFDKL